MKGNEGPPAVGCTKDRRLVGDQTFPGSRPHESGVEPFGRPRTAEDATHADVRQMARVVADLRAENEMLLLKLARVSTATRGLAGDLARSKRENRRKQLELESLHALVSAAGAPARDDSSARGASAQARGSSESPQIARLSPDQRESSLTDLSRGVHGRDARVPLGEGPGRRR